MTKTAACKQALAETPELRPFGGQWMYSWLDHRANAWCETHPTNYHAAQGSRRVHLIERARTILDPEYAGHGRMESGDFVGGPWQSYVQ